MVGLPFDCLANPLGAVRLTFEKAVTSGTDPATFDGRDWGAIDLFREFLFDKGGLSKVPILDHENVRWIEPNSLVRFRGMVQDMLGNEFYVGAFKDGSTWRTNKFTDVASFPMGSSSEVKVWERRLLYCIPVPAQNSWTQAIHSETVVNRYKNQTSQHGEKRHREDDAAVDHMDSTASEHEFQGSPPLSKKMCEGTLPSWTQESASNSSKLSMIPDFDQSSLPCLVKIYDLLESDLKLNDVFDFVGVFTFNPELAVHMDESDEFSNGVCEDALVHLPPSKVPRLHCFIHRKLGVHDFLHSPPITEPTPHLVRGIRESLLGHLTAILGNDGVAAHCMVLHLLSKVHARVDTVAVGKLSLNLTGFTKESASIFGNQLNLAIQNLLPFTRSIPLTVEYLNSASIAPRKDYQTDRLVTGVLQLAEGTHLTIDETQLKAGTLNSIGVENVRLLKNLMEWQKVDYDFEYYKMEMTSDVQILIFSEGKSNILPADLVLPFRPSAMSSCENKGTEVLQAWRWYLTTLRSMPHSIEPEMQKICLQAIEDDLVAARQANRSLGSQDFSRWLAMARLMSASFGESCLSLEHWQMVKELERQRRERLG
ncbi:PREDICTED: mini-chromosome maintenance complex-binding protein-like isoform X1 [Nelumbo nucifera]|uniref:Mini-chromosome maintenance complex-binding protein-like isoform X1 n=1 Tax=Nelumbo nucifera TaxID=4432 RepID=A0A1U7ZH60_NELNU|nr:PREDICTED: mini-chromosome maintenance complex-binding protein-like isoform X1 [Nelumbo nucifera]